MRKNQYCVGEQILNEKEFIKYVFGTGKVLSVKDPMLLSCALEIGEYIIGASYNPFTLQNVYHFKNNVFKVFNFTPGCHMEPLNIQQTYECDNISLGEVVNMIFSFGQHDALLINPTKDMLNLNNIEKF